jgi:hypothetical protein
MQWDTALRLWPAVSSIVLFVIQGAFFVIIKFNDVRHLHKEVIRLAKEQKECTNGQTDIRERLAKIEGKLDILVDHTINKSIQLK